MKSATAAYPMLIRRLTALLAALTLAACASDTPSQEDAAGVTSNFSQQAANLTSRELEDRVLGITDGADAVNPQWRVNGFLWRAALDTFSFMPLRSFDTVAGTIETEWYQMGRNPNERRRVTVQITSAALIPSSLRVNLFKQQRRSPSSSWQNMPPAGAPVIRSLEDAVLSRARQLRLIALELE